jgi:hypothetical protein
MHSALQGLIYWSPFLLLITDAVSIENIRIVTVIGLLMNMEQVVE